jgi:hypothetical protein
MKNYILVALLAFSADFLWSQVNQADSSKQYVIVKQNGSEYIGSIISDDGREVLIQTSTLGKIYILKSDIKSITLIDKKDSIVNGEYRSSGPFSTRYAFTTNAHPIKKGENYSMINLFGPEVHFAVSNNFNIGLMSTWIASPIALAMKNTFKSSDSKINYSLGTLVGTSGYLNRFRSFGGLHWVSMTLGDRMMNFTLSAGYGYINSGRSQSVEVVGEYYNTTPNTINRIRPMAHGPLFSIAGICKVGAKASFVFDSMFFIYNREYVETEYITQPGENFIYRVKNVEYRMTGMLLMPGMRFQKTENKAFQFSLAGLSLFGKEDQSFPLPMLSWFQKF